MGPNLYIYIHDPEQAEQVLKGRTTLNKPKVYEAISDALGGDGLFTANGNKILRFAWNNARMIQLLFQFR